MGVKLNKEHGYEYVTKWVKTDHENKVTIFLKQKFNLQKKLWSKSDDIICDNETGAYLLIDTATSGNW